MRKILSLFLLFTFSFTIAQINESCKCDLLKKTEDSIEHSYSKDQFKPVSKSAALKSPYKFISVKYLKNFSRKKDIIDSIELKTKNILVGKIPDTVFGDYKIRDSIRKIEYSKKYGDIPRPVIIKTGELNGVTAILYSTKSGYEPKYYLRISNDQGKTWKNYYTGLKENNNYIFKSNSQYPLWKDKNKIQIEADIVRMVKNPSFPSNPDGKYETIKNNALVTMNIDEVLKDSDNDGINDMEEIQELFTNPYASDTDNDGINDFEDTNPRYKSIDNDFTKLLYAIIYSDYTLIENSNPYIVEFIINTKTFHHDIQHQREKNTLEYPKENIGFLDSVDRKIIITDNIYLRKIQPLDEKIIFLTSKEFSEYVKFSFMNHYNIRYSKLFKCDELEDTYILTIDYLSRGESYLITKIPEGWKVRILHGWQS